jgi:hypothetical protein
VESGSGGADEEEWGVGVCETQFDWETVLIEEVALLTSTV